MKPSINLRLKRQRHLVISALVFNALNPPLVVFLNLFLFTDMVTDLHLPLDKVFGLSERTDELLTFFPFEDSDFLLVDYVGNF